MSLVAYGNNFARGIVPQSMDEQFCSFLHSATLDALVDPCKTGQIPDGNTSPCIMKTYALNNNFIIDGTEDIMAVFNLNCPTCVGYLYRRQNNTWRPFDKIMTVAQSEQFSKVRTVSCALSIYSDTISTTNATLSGNISCVVVEEISDLDNITYSNITSYGLTKQMYKINTKLWNGLVLKNSLSSNSPYVDLDDVNYHDGSYVTTIHVTQPATYGLPDIGGFYKAYSKMQAKIKFRQNVYVDFRVVNDHFKLYGGNSNGDANYLNEQKFTWDAHGGAFEITVSQPPDGQAFLPFDIEIYDCDPITGNFGQLRHIVIIQGNTGTKNIIIAGNQSQQLVPHMRAYSQVNAVLPVAYSPAVYEIYNCLLAMDKLKYVFTRQEYEEFMNWYYGTSDEEIVYATTDASVSGTASPLSIITSLIPIYKGGIAALKKLGIRPADVLRKGLNWLGKGANSLINYMESAGYASKDGPVATASKPDGKIDLKPVPMATIEELREMYEGSYDWKKSKQPVKMFPPNTFQDFIDAEKKKSYKLAESNIKAEVEDLKEQILVLKKVVEEIPSLKEQVRKLKVKNDKYRFVKNKLMADLSAEMRHYDDWVSGINENTRGSIHQALAPIMVKADFQFLDLDAQASGNQLYQTLDDKPMVPFNLLLNGQYQQQPSIQRVMEPVQNPEIRDGVYRDPHYQWANQLGTVFGTASGNEGNIPFNTNVIDQYKSQDLGGDPKTMDPGSLYDFDNDQVDNQLNSDKKPHEVEKKRDDFNYVLGTKSAREMIYSTIKWRRYNVLAHLARRDFDGWEQLETFSLFKLVIRLPNKEVAADSMLIKVTTIPTMGSDDYEVLGPYAIDKKWTPGSDKASFSAMIALEDRFSSLSSMLYSQDRKLYVEFDGTLLKKYKIGFTGPSWFAAFYAAIFANDPWAFYEGTLESYAFEPKLEGHSEGTDIFINWVPVGDLSYKIKAMTWDGKTEEDLRNILGSLPLLAMVHATEAKSLLNGELVKQVTVGAEFKQNPRYHPTVTLVGCDISRLLRFNHPNYMETLRESRIISKVDSEQAIQIFKELGVYEDYSQISALRRANKMKAFVELLNSYAVAVRRLERATKNNAPKEKIEVAIKNVGDNIKMLVKSQLEKQGKEGKPKAPKKDVRNILYTNTLNFKTKPKVKTDTSKFITNRTLDFGDLDKK